MPHDLARTLNTLTVAKLRAKLAGLPDDQPVMVCVPSGDHWRTELAAPIGDVRPVDIVRSTYHRGFRLPRDPDEPAPDALNVILLGGV